VQLASATGKIGFAGAVTYCASKHAVVGLSEALRQELRDSGIEISVVMPTAVNTELGSGLGVTRAFKAVEPEDVADAIVEALQTGRFEVYVPKSLGATIRGGALMPRKALDAISHLLKGDEVLSHLDLQARRAYDERIARGARPASTAAAPQPAAAGESEPEPQAAEPPTASAAH
jgi:hypothetical protein